MGSVEALIRQAPQTFRSEWEALFFCLTTMPIVKQCPISKVAPQYWVRHCFLHHFWELKTWLNWLWWLQVQAMMKPQLTSSCKGLWKHRVFYTTHFTWVHWLPCSYTGMKTAQWSRGQFPEYQTTNFQLFHCYKVFPYTQHNHCGSHLNWLALAKANLAKHRGIFQVFFHRAHFSDKISRNTFWGCTA